MLYYWLKYTVRLVLRIYYRKRVMTGIENIPATGPVIFACNHPNSFLDAMIVGTYAQREMHFLARSDVFNSPLKLWILSKFNMIPIYRLQEGVENLDKNRVTFERCQQIFRKGGAVLIFSEGICIQELRLRSLKKGTARIAMEYAKDGSPLMVIPTGLNYLKATKFRESILIDLGKPFNAADYAKEYNENTSRGILSFNKRLDAGLRDVVINIQDKSNEKDLELLVDIQSNEPGSGLEVMVRTIRNLNHAAKAGQPEYTSLLSLLSKYRSALTQNRATDHSVVAQSIPGSPLALGLSYALAIPFIPVGLLVRFIAKKAVKRVEFYDSVLLGGAAILYTVFGLILAIVLGMTIGWLKMLIVFVCLYAVLHISVALYDLGIRGRTMASGKQRDDLRATRASILSTVSELNRQNVEAVAVSQPAN